MTNYGCEPRESVAGGGPRGGWDDVEPGGEIPPGLRAQFWERGDTDADIAVKIGLVDDPEEWQNASNGGDDS